MENDWKREHLKLRCAFCGESTRVEFGVFMSGGVTRCENCNAVVSEEPDIVRRPLAPDKARALVGAVDLLMGKFEFRDAKISFETLFRLYPEYKTDPGICWMYMKSCCGIAEVKVDEQWYPTIFDPESFIGSYAEAAQTVSVASQHGDSERLYYGNRLAEMNQLFRSYNNAAQTAPEYDFFICVKQALPGHENEYREDSNGRTMDYEIGMSLYHYLNDLGYSVFNSARMQIGTNNPEATIALALHKSRNMIVVGSKGEYVESKWTRNEWQRFLWRKERDKNLGLFCVLYGMRADGLPDDLRGIQNLELSREFGKVDWQNFPWGQKAEEYGSLSRFLRYHPPMNRQDSGIQPDPNFNQQWNMNPFRTECYRLMNNQQWDRLRTKLGEFRANAPKEMTNEQYAEICMLALQAKFEVSREKDLGRLWTPIDQEPDYLSARDCKNQKVTTRLNKYNKEIADRLKKEKHLADCTDQDFVGIEARFWASWKELRAMITNHADEIKKAGKQEIDAVCELCASVGSMAPVYFAEEVRKINSGFLNALNKYYEESIRVGNEVIALRKKYAHTRAKLNFLSGISALCWIPMLASPLFMGYRVLKFADSFFGMQKGNDWYGIMSGVFALWNDGFPPFKSAEFGCCAILIMALLLLLECAKCVLVNIFRDVRKRSCDFDAAGSTVVLALIAMGAVLLFSAINVMPSLKILRMGGRYQYLTGVLCLFLPLFWGVLHTAFFGGRLSDAWKRNEESWKKQIRDMPDDMSGDKQLIHRLVKWKAGIETSEAALKEINQ